MSYDPPIRLGMVGGGEGALIGNVHRIAARLDGRFDLVAGALSSEPERARRSAAAIGIAPERSYGDFAEMARAEAARPDGIEAVAIVTPNHVHYPAAKAFLEAGIHVICDKPLTASLDDAKALAAQAAASDKVFALTHNYTGYPLVRQARAMVAAGELGPIQVIQVEYPQDWLSTPLERTGQKQAEWRGDPARSGVGGCVADIGSHAHNLACFVTGLKLASVAADLDRFVPGRALDDNAHVLLRFEPRDGVAAKGALWSSQVSPGHENDLRLRVYGHKAGLAWSQTEPNKMAFTPLGEPRRILTRAGSGANEAANAVSRIPGGHPEGYFEAFATLYSESAQAIRAAQRGEPRPAGLLVPTVEDGLEGMRFIEACVRSSQNDAAWTRLADL